MRCTAAEASSLVAWLVLAAWLVALPCATAGGDHGGAEQGVESSDACALQPLEDYDLGLHIGSVFILLGVSMCGAFAPVLLSIFQAKWVIILIRCGTVVKSFPLLGGQMSPSGMAFGFGTILATGFVHMLGASISYFSNPCLSGAWADYSSWGMVFCLIAILFMQIFDYIIETVLHRKKIKRAETAKEAALAAKVTEQAAADKVVPNVELDAEAGCLEGCAGPSQPAQEYMHEVAVKDLELTGHHFVTDVDVAESSKLSMYLVEAGIVMHSILIGLALGVASGSEFTTLLIAISFHQFFEGLAIGASAVSVGLSFWRSLLLGLIYSLTTPIGIAIGIGIRDSWNANSSSTIVAQGIVDGLAAGILIYVVLVDLITPMLTKSSWMRRQHWFIQLAMLAFFWAGVAVMAVIGTWA